MELRDETMLAAVVRLAIAHDVERIVLIEVPNCDWLVGLIGFALSAYLGLLEGHCHYRSPRARHAPIGHI